MVREKLWQPYGMDMELFGTVWLWLFLSAFIEIWIVILFKLNFFGLGFFIMLTYFVSTVLLIRFLSDRQE